MEVTQIDHQSTHAILGDSKAIAYSVNMDDQFFEILSSTLYSKKELAVVREILCNGWDAHIEAKIAKKPVEITLTDSEMIFRDYGLGIPRDQMAAIYCTYSGSTKRHDGRVTGGFGLGTKAPFAYAKNFTVTSINNGIKTVWNMSRGTAETKGVPDAREIVSVPTTEPSGVIVTVPVAVTDKLTFYKLIKYVAQTGGINATLNGEKLVKLPWHKANKGYLLFHEQVLQHNELINSEIAIKYGAVVYPLEKVFIRNLVKGFPQKLNNIYEYLNRVEVRLVIEAPPNSVGITPSRESLSLTEGTKETLEVLVRSAYESLHEVFVDRVNKRVAEFDLQNALPNVEGHNLANLLHAYHNADKTLANHVKNQISQLVYSGETLNRKQVFHTDDQISSLFSKYLGQYPAAIEHVNVVQDFDEQAVAAFKQKVKKTLFQKYPFYAKKIINLEKNEILTSDFKRILLYTLKPQYQKHMGQMVRLLDWIEKEIPEGETYIHTGLEGLYKETIKRKIVATWMSPDGRAEEIFHNGLKGSMKDVTILIATSKAAMARVHKSSKILDNKPIVIMVPKKALALKAYAMLSKYKQFADVILVESLDKQIKESKSLNHKFLRSASPTKFEAVAIEGLEPKYYIYAPRAVMFKPKERDSVEQKIGISDKALTIIAYAYPETVIVTSTTEAKYAEGQGLRNVFEVLSQEVMEFFSKEENHFLMFSHMSTLAPDLMTSTMALLMKHLSVGNLFELLDVPVPKGITFVDMPSHIYGFLELVSGRIVPRYGLQHTSKVAQKAHEILEGYIGKGLSPLLLDSQFHEFLYNIRAIEPNILTRNAVLSSLQTVRLHQALRRKG